MTKKSAKKIKPLKSIKQTTYQAMLWMFMLLSMTGCQLLTGYQKIDRGNNHGNQAQISSNQSKAIVNSEHDISLSCAGSYHCEIERVDDVHLIDADTHQPLVAVKGDAMTMPDLPKSESKNNHTVDLYKLGKSALNVELKLDNHFDKTNPNHQANHDLYFVRTNLGKHRLRVNFYPEKNDSYVESMDIFYDFDKSGHYLLKAFAKSQNHVSGKSLLDSAAPPTLCVDIIYKKDRLKRFCRTDKADNAEYVDTDINQKNQPAG